MWANQWEDQFQAEAGEAAVEVADYQDQVEAGTSDPQEHQLAFLEWHD